MRIRSLLAAFSPLLLGLATLAAPKAVQAQPMWDRVDVNLPYSVTVGNKTLQPGEYTIEQQEEPTGDSGILLIYGDHGMVFETSTLAIPAMRNYAEPDTRVTLHHVGNNYYFDTIWVQGKNYGYEFPLP